MNNKRGSSFVFVITMVALLAIIATGFFYMMTFSIETGMDNQKELQRLYMAKSIHRAVCEAAENGDLEILDYILEAASEEPEPVQDSYEAATGNLPIVLQDGSEAVVSITILCEIEEETTAVIDTVVTYAGERRYEFSACLRAEEGQWKVIRHYGSDGNIAAE